MGRWHAFWRRIGQIPAVGEDRQAYPISFIVLLIHFGAVILQGWWLTVTETPLIPVVTLVLTTLSLLHWIVMRHRRGQD